MAILYPKFTVKIVLGIRKFNSIAVHASLMQIHCYDQACVFSTFHTTYIRTMKAFPYAFSHIILGSFLVSSHIAFLAAFSKIFSLPIGLLPGNHKICLPVLLPACKQCFRFPFFTFFSKSASCRLLLLMFVYFTAYK